MNNTPVKYGLIQREINALRCNILAAGRIGIVAFTLMLFLAFLPAHAISASLNFEWANPLPQGLTLGGSCSGAGGDGTILTSTDGIVWTKRDTGTTAFMSDVVWNGSIFLAIGSTVLTSPDGIVWTEQSTGTAGNPHSIVWSGTQFVGIGGGAYSLQYALTSPDGITWTRQNDLGTTTSVPSLAWNGSKFIAVGGMEWVNGAYGNALIFTSSDGVSWIKQDSGLMTILYDVTWGGTQFVATGYKEVYPNNSYGPSAVVLTSPDGVTWSLQNSGAPTTLYSVVWSGTKYVATGDNGLAYTSSDAITWVERITDAKTPVRHVSWAGSQFLATGWYGEFLTSPDGISWTKRSSGTIAGVRAIARNTTQYVGVGDATYNSSTASYNPAVIVTSPDGIVWTERSSGTSNSLAGISTNGPLYVAVGASGTIITSLDGITWTVQNSGNANELKSVAWNGARYVVVGKNTYSIPIVLTSPDGVTWTPQSVAGATGLNSVEWNGTQFIAVGNSAWLSGGPSPASIISSSDGISWTVRSLATYKNHLYGITWDGNQFAASGDMGAVLTSPDGISWTYHSTGSSYGLTDIYWTGSQFVTTETNGSISTSPDAVNWTMQSLATGVYLTAVAGNAGQIIVTGVGGAILRSVNSTVPSDTESPVVVPPNDINIAADSTVGTPAQHATIAAFLNGSVASDNVDSSVAISTNAPTTFPVGATTVTFSATDAAGNTGTATAIVTVLPYVDTASPAVTPPANTSIYSTSSAGVLSSNAVVAVFLNGASASDNVGVVGSITTNAPLTLPMGDITVRFIARDAAGNVGSSTALITVLTASGASGLSPANGSTLSDGTLNLSWLDAGASDYWLYVGSSIGGSNYFKQALVGGSNASSATNLPTDGHSVIYVRLWSKVNGGWSYIDNTYNSAAPVATTISTPVNGAMLIGGSQLFSWTDVGASAYFLYVGSSIGSSNYSRQSLAAGSTSATTTGLPTDGSAVYVRLWSNVSGSWSAADYNYTAANIAPTVAAIVSPTDGATLTGASQTFTWNDSGASNYYLYVGKGVGSSAYGRVATGSGVTSALINTLPANDSTVYVRLWSKVDGRWTYSDSSYLSQ